MTRPRHKYIRQRPLYARRGVEIGENPLSKPNDKAVAAAASKLEKTSVAVSPPPCNRAIYAGARPCAISSGTRYSSDINYPIIYLLSAAVAATFRYKIFHYIFLGTYYTYMRVVLCVCAQRIERVCSRFERACAVCIGPDTGAREKGP